MKSYPYIGKFQSTVKLFHTPTNFQPIESGHGFNRHEMNYTDITHEYLSNTWGVVESKEHAEFIIGLAEANGFTIYNDSYPIRKDIFSFNKHGTLFFHEDNGLKLSNKLKQITIPLPPKVKVEKPDFSAFPKHFDCVCVKCGGKCCAGFCDKESELPEAGHNLVFAAHECKEWPCVGDEVLIDLSGHDVIYGQNVNGLIAEVRSVFKDGEATVYAICRDGACYCFTGGILKKPKTPEEELRDEIADIIDNASCSEQAAEYIVKEYLAAISKKPQ